MAYRRSPDVQVESVAVIGWKDFEQGDKEAKSYRQILVVMTWILKQ